MFGIRKPSKLDEKGMFAEVTGDANHVFVNTVIYNNGTGTMNAYFNRTFSEPIIDKASDWELAITRFTIPLTSVPLFTFDLSTGAYSVTLSTTGTTQRQNIQYVSITNPSISTTTGIFYYQQMTDYINTAFQASYTALTGALGMGNLSSTTAPYIIYDPYSSLFSLVAQKAYNSDGIGIWMNTNLFNLFQTWESFFNSNNDVNGKDVNIYLKDNKNNTTNINPSIPTGCYQMNQEYPSVYFWNSLKSVQFTSGSLPTRKEFTPLPYTKDDNNSSVSANFQNIMVDFEPIQTANASEVRSSLQYQPSVYKYVDLTGDRPIYQIDYQVSWNSVDGVNTPLSIYEKFGITTKFCFKRKNPLGISSN